MRGTYVGALSEESSSSSSKGSSSSRKACCGCVCVNGIAGNEEDCVGMVMHYSDSYEPKMLLSSPKTFASRLSKAKRVSTSRGRPEQTVVPA
jgi:hypothetical protein